LKPGRKVFKNKKKGVKPGMNTLGANQEKSLWGDKEKRSEKKKRKAQHRPASILKGKQKRLCLSQGDSVKNDPPKSAVQRVHWERSAKK